MSGSLPVQYSKIQLKRGLSSTLPGIPLSGSQTPTAGLDIAELGYATDQGRLFIGIDPASGLPQLQRGVYPYDNIEVVTENSTDFLQNNFDANMQDMQTSYIQSDKLINQSSDFSTAYNVTVNQTPFYINLLNNNVGQAQIYYQLFQLSSTGQQPVPLKTGIIKVTYSNNSMECSMTDCGTSFSNTLYTGTDPNYAYGGFSFSGQYVGGNLILQYTNVTSYLPTLFFRIERVSA